MCLRLFSIFTVWTPADSGIKISDIQPETPIGFSISSSGNQIVGFSASEVTIAASAPEIIPLMKVTLSEDTIAVEVCIDQAEFDSPDGEPANLQVGTNTPPNINVHKSCIRKSPVAYSVP